MTHCQQYQQLVEDQRVSFNEMIQAERKRGGSEEIEYWMKNWAYGLVRLETSVHEMRCRTCLDRLAGRSPSATSGGPGAA